MTRLAFNSRGEFVGADQKLGEFAPIQKREDLKTTDSLEFLKPAEKFENIFQGQHWSLYENKKPLAPLKFSNGKTQEDVVKEVVDLINKGEKVIFLHGVCGTGKSAIALNIARSLGNASIVVPVKGLQKQYEEDYMGKKQVIKKNGEKMKIAMITGRENHDSKILPGISCADPFLPDTIKITEKNFSKIKEYYKDNPFISNTAPPSIRKLRRISIAPSNPYWSPIIPAEIEVNQLADAKKKTYVGMGGRKFTFYHRKQGCSYYDQYLSYFNADVIIFNAAKYLAEISLKRKPQTEVDIIDEADEFLDKLSSSVEINLTRLRNSLNTIIPENEKAKESIKRIIELIDAEETNKRVVGIEKNKVFELGKTKIEEILKILLKDKELEVEIELDETNYANSGLEAAREFEGCFKDTYLTYKKEDGFLFATLVTTELSRRFNTIVDGNKALVLMSGTLHSEEVLKHVFGIKEYSLVEAETLNPGSIEIFRTGKEFNCSYANLKSSGSSRENYIQALSEIVEKSTKPTLIHVNAFKDLPTAEESYDFKTTNLIQDQELKDIQYKDKNGDAIIEFKKGKTNKLFTTKCSRGIDFPGDTCKSVVFTKYPNPNVQDTFWKILQKTHPDHYWEFYKDKAKREFLQRIYRAVRSKNDHVFIASPDMRVIQAVQELQNQSNR